MPTSPEAYLISSVLRERDYTTAVAHGISSEMFHGYADEWEWIEKYHSKYRRTPTRTAFLNHFPDFRIKQVNDTAHFVDEVRKSHARQMLTGVMRDTADLIAQGDIDGAVGKMQSSMVVVAASMGSVLDTDIFSDWRGVYDDVKGRKQRYEEFGMAGIPTGFETLDERTGGVQPGQSWIYAARLGEGKSWGLLRSATTAVMAGHNVQFDALEMTRAEVGMRVHNFMSSSVGQDIFRSLDLSQGKDFDIKAYRNFLKNLASTVKGQMHVSDTKRIGSVEIAAQIERNHPDIVFLDYLTLAKTQGDGGWLDIGRLSKDLKALAGNYSVGMVSAAQLNREAAAGKGMPGAETLSQADAIGQDADAVITMRKRSERVTEMYLAKFRHGRAGYSWHTHMDMTKGIYQEVSYNKAMDLIDEDVEIAAREKEDSR